MRLAVEILNVLRAQERQASLELFQVFLTQNVVFAYVGTPGHSARLYNIRFLFAHAFKVIQIRGEFAPRIVHLRFALRSRFESRHLHYPDARTVGRRGVVAARGIDRFVLGNVPVQIDHPRSESSPCG